MENQRIKMFKTLVDENNLFEIQEQILALQDAAIQGEVKPDWAVLFYRVYLHACLKGRKAIAEWLENDVYFRLDTQTQIYLRQIFPYGHTLLRKSDRK